MFERFPALARQASKAKVAVALFPELGLSAYSNDDLFHQDALLDASKAAVARLTGAARGNHRDSHPVRDQPGYFEIVAGLGAVGIDRVDA